MMLKTIKKNVQMRLDELIKYAFENNIKNKVYRSDNGKSVMFLGNERFESGWDIGSEDLFTVEIEEEITEDTEFGLLVEISKNDKKYLSFTHYNFKLNQVIECDTKLIYALIDGKLELIWESEE